jgi:hypothetical protein
MSFCRSVLVMHISPSLSATRTRDASRNAHARPRKHVFHEQSEQQDRLSQELASRATAWADLKVEYDFTLEQLQKHNQKEDHDERDLPDGGTLIDFPPGALFFFCSDNFWSICVPLSVYVSFIRPGCSHVHKRVHVATCGLVSFQLSNPFPPSTRAPPSPLLRRRMPIASSFPLPTAARFVCVWGDIFFEKSVFLGTFLESSVGVSSLSAFCFSFENPLYLVDIECRIPVATRELSHLFDNPYIYRATDVGFPLIKRERWFCRLSLAMYLWSSLASPCTRMPDETHTSKRP